jgi:hypothetical protein
LSNNKLWSHERFYVVVVVVVAVDYDDDDSNLINCLTKRILIRIPRLSGVQVCKDFGKAIEVSTRCFKYDRDDLCVKKSQFVPVIFEPPCISKCAER